MANVKNLLGSHLQLHTSRVNIIRILVRVNEMYTNEEYCEMVLLYWLCNQNKREVANFPIEDIYLIVHLPLLFNTCIKLDIVIDVFPCLVPHLEASGYPLRMF